jgi:hypothetical protein
MMDLEEFDSTSSSFIIDRINNANKVKYDIEVAYRKEQFLLKYPSLDWNQLVIQKRNIITHDGCTHYKYRNTNKVYSWKTGFGEPCWIEHNESNEKYFLERLFD